MNVEAVLALAAHPTSNRNEAINSLNMLHNYATRKGVSLADLLRAPNSMPSYSPGIQPVASYLRQIDELEVQVSNLNKHVAQLTSDIRVLKNENRSLQRENLDLRRKLTQVTNNGSSSSENIVEISVKTGNKSHKPVEIDEPVVDEAVADEPAPEPVHPDTPRDNSFAAFEAACIAASGRKHGWKTYVAAVFGIETPWIYAWERKGIVPDSFVAKVSEIPSAAKRTAPRWTEAEVARVYELIGQGLKIRQIAENLSKEFGRPINENTVKGYKHKYTYGQ